MARRKVKVATTKGMVFKTKPEYVMSEEMLEVFTQVKEDRVKLGIKNLKAVGICGKIFSTL